MRLPRSWPSWKATSDDGIEARCHRAVATPAVLRPFCGARARVSAGVNADRADVVGCDIPARVNADRAGDVAGACHHRRAAGMKDATLFIHRLATADAYTTY